MNTWHSWVALIVGIIAIAGQWWPDFWLPVIGGVLAAIAGIAMMTTK